MFTIISMNNFSPIRQLFSSAVQEKTKTRYSLNYVNKEKTRTLVLSENHFLIDGSLKVPLKLKVSDAFKWRYCF